MAAVRQPFRAMNSDNPGRSSSENSSAVRSQSLLPGTPSSSAKKRLLAASQRAGRAASPKAAASRVVTRVRPDRWRASDDFVVSRKIMKLEPP